MLQGRVDRFGLHRAVVPEIWLNLVCSSCYCGTAEVEFAICHKIS